MAISSDSPTIITQAVQLDRRAARRLPRVCLLRGPSSSATSNSSCAATSMTVDESRSLATSLFVLRSMRNVEKICDRATKNIALLSERFSQNSERNRFPRTHVFACTGLCSFFGLFMCLEVTQDFRTKQQGGSRVSDPYIKTSILLPRPEAPKARIEVVSCRSVG